METTETNLFIELKAKYTVSHPATIREKLAEWAFEGAESIDQVIRCLETIDCAACHSPAPIYYHDMAAEIAQVWPEIDEAIDGYRDATGEAWAPRENQNFLTYLWFAYEWIAHELASRISSDIDD
jgi:hypothetical protein